MQLSDMIIMQYKGHVQRQFLILSICSLAARAVIDTISQGMGVHATDATDPHGKKSVRNRVHFHEVSRQRIMK